MSDLTLSEVGDEMHAGMEGRRIVLFIHSLRKRSRSRRRHKSEESKQRKSTDSRRAKTNIMSYICLVKFRLRVKGADVSQEPRKKKIENQ